MLSSILYLPTASASEPCNSLSGEVQQNVFDSEQERNQFLLDFALTAPEKGMGHILVHENVSHKNGDLKPTAARVGQNPKMQTELKVLSKRSFEQTPDKRIASKADHGG